MFNFDINTILKPNEKLVYKNKNNKGIYPIFEIVALILLFIFSVAGDGFIIGASVVKSLVEKSSALSALIFIFCLIIHTISLMVWAIWLLKRIQANKMLWLVITNNRIMKVYNKKIFEIKQVNIDEITNFIEKKDKIILEVGDELFYINSNNTKDLAKIINNLLENK